MVRVSFFVFGYSRIEIKPEQSAGLVSHLLKLGVTSATVSPGTYLVLRRDLPLIRPYLLRIGARIGDVQGLPTLLSLMRVRLPAVIALTLAVLLNFLLSGLVWDIRISGNDNVPDYVIKEALRDSGLYVGSVWSRLDRSMVETQASDALEGLGWINVNRRGTVAYVEVVERAVLPPAELTDTAPCNIVAAFDCVIEDIDVRRGVACVSPGDVVRRGDVLISGIVEGESGVSFVSASGSVTGQIGTEVSASASRFETVREVSSRSLAEVRLNIFNFSVNIFKNYRNSEGSCDIIEKNESFVVNNSKRLPVGLTRCYELIYTDRVCEYTDAELVNLAIGRHNAALAARISDGELIKISTAGEYTEQGYCVCSEIVYLADVGVGLEIGID